MFSARSFRAPLPGRFEKTNSARATSHGNVFAFSLRTEITVVGNACPAEQPAGRLGGHAESVPARDGQREEENEHHKADKENHVCGGLCGTAVFQKPYFFGLSDPRRQRDKSDIEYDEQQAVQRRNPVDERRSEQRGHQSAQKDKIDPAHPLVHPGSAVGRKEFGQNADRREDERHQRDDRHRRIHRYVPGQVPGRPDFQNSVIDGGRPQLQQPREHARRIRLRVLGDIRHGERRGNSLPEQSRIRKLRICGIVERLYIRRIGDKAGQENDDERAGDERQRRKQPAHPLLIRIGRLYFLRFAADQADRRSRRQTPRGGRGRFLGFRGRPGSLCRRFRSAPLRSRPGKSDAFARLFAHLVEISESLTAQPEPEQDENAQDGNERENIHREGKSRKQTRPEDIQSAAENISGRNPLCKEPIHKIDASQEETDQRHIRRAQPGERRGYPAYGKQQGKHERVFIVLEQQPREKIDEQQRRTGGEQRGQAKRKRTGAEQRHRRKHQHRRKGIEVGIHRIHAAFTVRRAAQHRAHGSEIPCLFLREIMIGRIGNHKGILRVDRIGQLRFAGGKALAELGVDGQGNHRAVHVETDDFVEIEIRIRGDGNAHGRQIFFRGHRGPVEPRALSRRTLRRIQVCDRDVADQRRRRPAGRRGTVHFHRDILARFRVNVSDVNIHRAQFGLPFFHVQIVYDGIFAARYIGESLSRALERAEKRKARRKKQHEQYDKCFAITRKSPFRRRAHFPHKNFRPPAFASRPTQGRARNTA